MLIDRRRFLESLGLLGGTALAACTEAPTERLSAYLEPPREMVPGIPSYWATVCRACPAGCGVLAKTREARPIKLEGNPRHPVNQGALCARGQAHIQNFYGRHRVQRPAIRGAEGLAPASWDAARAVVREKLTAASSLGVVTGLESGSLEDVITEFTARFPAGEHLAHEPLAPQALRRAAEILFGWDEMPRIDLSEADHVVSIGADLFDAWISPVEHARQWAQGHGVDGGRTMVLESFGPRRTLTANAADHYHPLSARQFGALALAIARRTLAAKRDTLAPEVATRIGALLGRLGAGIDESGLDSAVLDAVAARLARAKQGTVLYGATDLATEDATSIAAITLVTNWMTGALGSTVKFGEGSAWSKLGRDRDLVDLLERAGNGAVDVLVVYGTNPVHGLPAAIDAAGKLEKAPFVVALAYEETETTRLADVVLPVHHPLESWGDYEATSSIAGVMQPVRSPLYDTRHLGDVLLELARMRGGDTAHASFKDYVTARWSRRAGGASDAKLDRTLMDGGQFGEAVAAPTGHLVPEREWAALASLIPAASGGTQLVVPFTATLADGRDSAQDWLLETPDPVTQTSWDLPAELSLDVAEAAGIENGDRVALKAGGVTVPAIAYVLPDMAPGTVALRAGGGRPFTREELTAGNSLALLADRFDAVSGQLARASGTVTVERVGGGRIARVSGGSDSEDRDLCLAMGYADLAEGRYPVMTRHGDVAVGEQIHGAIVPMPKDEDPLEGERPADNIIKQVKHPDHRWGMVIDLDRCTGCSACVVACSAENNIPIVGRDEITKGRELSWLRIEQHIFGEGDDREIRFLPVMCQHCDQAPCESVCPVFAPYHTQDGLNAQVYNRCVGTRYCSNNCPYKVRRFNYFDYLRETPANQQLNPDVTVRPRGVMEKCTFCIQRIRERTNRAKAEDRSVADGEIQTACVQTCPTQALTFGDYKLPEAEMTKKAADPRGYRLLDFHVNTRPAVVYLRKVHSTREEA